MNVLNQQGYFTIRGIKLGVDRRLDLHVPTNTVGVDGQEVDLVNAELDAADGEVALLVQLLFEDLLGQ